MNASRLVVNTKQLPYDPNRLLPDDTNILVLDEDGNLSRRSTDSFPISSINRRQQYTNTEISDDDRIETGLISTVRENEPYSETAPTANNLVAGILDAETVAKHISKVGKTADSSSVSYLTLTLPGYGLRDISILSNYTHLQRIELPYNNISDLSPLDNLSYLLELDVSNNKIRKLFDFWPPCNLKEADFSFNLIEQIKNVDNFHYLQKLILDNNQISKIEGLKNCYRLQHLSLAHNRISQIEELDGLPLKYLNLRSNQIRNVENLDSLQYLQQLNLSCNQIDSLAGFPERLNFLEVLDLADNQLHNLADIDRLSEYRLLRDLNLRGNKITEIDDYRLSIIFKLQHLTILDRRKIDAAEKIESKQMFNPSSEYFASRDHMTNVVFSFLQDHRVQESTLPNIETPYPMLILSGPEGCGRIELAHRLVEEFSEFFGYGILHTAREKRANEKDRVDYIFIKQEQYEEDVTKGEFLCCYEYYGDWNGLQRSSIENVAREGLACVVQIELEGLLSIKQSHFEPRCVLLLPMDQQIHKRRLQLQGFEEGEITMALNRVELYAEYNRTHPGFFDAFILTNSLEDGYEQLRDLVISYLGLEDDRLDAPRPNTSDEIKRFDDFDIQRSDSFLPSTNATGCRNSSHPSVDTPTIQGTNGTHQNIRLKFGGSAPPAIMSSEFSLRLSAKSRIQDLFDAKTTNVKNQLRQQISRTVPIVTRKDNTNINHSQTNDHRGAKSAPTNDFQIDPSKHSPDSSIDNTPYQEDILLLDQNSYNDLQGDVDDNMSVRS
ncbi:unnamed protein product [Rotaria sordida]|uniref:Guanylate kinase-like domain-containing protein n=1 Tax=Rotaria sordida TaxID=392033 RepID=A0A818KVF3_9BILA|nr:unnamed protein product [Rotaria sordida]CAF1389244.1 unnamed protein product [Rotaria sordida]CAF1462996.1 unnamed protein product [Rotaria sordida]CAF1464096.1 unnamed protein product [Rotaria sordida]CAF1619606.1 unnamed protein product [Rotaria sordida]